LSASGLFFNRQFAEELKSRGNCISQPQDVKLSDVSDLKRSCGRCSEFYVDSSHRLTVRFLRQTVGRLERLADPYRYRRSRDDIILNRAAALGMLEELRDCGRALGKAGQQLLPEDQARIAEMVFVLQPIVGPNVLRHLGELLGCMKTPPFPWYACAN